MIALSTSDNIWLLLEDVDDDGDHGPWTISTANSRRSIWLSLETGEVRRLDLCMRVLFAMGWREMPGLQDKCGK